MTDLTPAFIARPAKETTLANAVQMFLAVSFKGRAYRTKLLAQHILEEFEIFVGHNQIDRLTFIKWDEFQEKKGLAADTINKKGRHLRAFLKWCEANELMAKAPVSYVIKHQSTPRPLPQIYTDDEYEMIKKATRGTIHHYLTILGRNTGMSLIDCCYLRWPSVNMETLHIHTNRIKLAWRGFESSQFWVPILANSDLHLLLEEQSKMRTNFGNERDEFVNIDAKGRYDYAMHHLSTQYGRILKRLGIKGKTFKNWRNTFISMLANSGMNLALACKMSGHKSPDIFASYIRPDVESMRTGLQSAFQWQAGKEVKLLRKPQA